MGVVIPERGEDCRVITGLGVELGECSEGVRVGLWLAHRLDQ